MAQNGLPEGSDNPRELCHIPQSAQQQEILLVATAQSHPITIEFLKRSSTEISRRVLAIKEEHVPNNLTHTTLAQPEMLSGAPFVVTDNTAGALIAFYYLGHKLAGHVGLAHGGMSAVLLDECMGRACFPRLAGRIAVTAKLDIEYKSPVKLGRVVLVQASTTKVEGRKAWVEATLEDAADGQTLVRASGFFIEPKWAASMSPMLP